MPGTNKNTLVTVMSLFGRSNLNKCDFITLICLSFQLYAAISQGESGLRLGLVPGGSLITSLKHRVVALASNSGVLSTVQTAAQAVLQNGWSLLLPTAEERARALSALLPTAGIMAYSHCRGTDRYKIQGTGMGQVGPDKLYRNVHTDLRRERNQDPLFSIVLVQFPVPIPFPYSVNKPLDTLKQDLVYDLPSLGPPVENDRII